MLSFFLNVSHSQNKLPSSEHIISNLIYTKLTFCLWALPFVFLSDYWVMKTFEVLGFHPSLAQGILLKPWISTRWWSNLLSTCMYNETCWKSELFSTWKSKHLPDFLPLCASTLGPCVSFPFLWQHSSRCGMWMGRVSCLDGEEGSLQRTVALLMWKEQGRCCSSDGWAAEMQVLLWCGDPVYNPFSPCWVLISSREDFLQHYYFLCISARAASVPFRSLAYYLENCK